MSELDRAAALERIAGEVRACTNCRLHETRTRAVPGEGSPETEVVFVGEGPGFNEDREGRPFVGRAGALLVKFLATLGWRRDEVFITNIVKCRPPENRDPEPDEIAACAPYLRRQLEILDPALVVTLGRHSLGRFMPGERISAAHGTVRPIDPSTGASNALAFALYHPAAALRAPQIERTSYADFARIPAALLESRARREGPAAQVEPFRAASNEPSSLDAITITAEPGPLALAPAQDPEPAAELVAVAAGVGVAVAAAPAPTSDHSYLTSSEPTGLDDQLTLF
jgi:uracil-DNA glycosylase